VIWIVRILLLGLVGWFLLKSLGLRMDPQGMHNRQASRSCLLALALIVLLVVSFLVKLPGIR